VAAEPEQAPEMADELLRLSLPAQPGVRPGQALHVVAAPGAVRWYDSKGSLCP